MNFKNLLTQKVLFLFLIVVNVNFAQQLKQGDGFRISFLNINEKISGDYFIQDNGEIQLPYLGLINTLNEDFPKIKSDIISGYSKIYRNPEIDVQPLLRINILGEVANPGVFYLSGFETLSELIALADGETNDSDTDEIIIIRKDSVFELDLESFLEGKNNLNDIGIESGDKIFVPRTWWVGARDASILVSGVAVLVAIASLFTR